MTLETTSSALAEVVDSQIVRDLPVNGRDFRELFKMAPGVQAANNPGNISVNGTRTSFIPTPPTAASSSGTHLG